MWLLKSSLLLPPLLLSMFSPPSSAYPHHPSPQLHLTPYKFHLTFKPPPRRISSPDHHRTPQQQQPLIPETPAQDRFFEDFISQPASIVPKLFGDKPFWVPHAYFNLCPFVRGPDIDPVWSAGCAPLPYPEMSNYTPQNAQAMYTRLQALQQAQEEQAQKEEEGPSWWEQYMPTGPADFGMANMYGPVSQQEMYSNYYYGGGGEADEEPGGGGGGASARGGGHVRSSGGNSRTKPRNPGLFWGGGGGTGGFWG